VSRIGDTSENDTSFAVRDTAERSKSQTILAAIKGLFRSAAKAITNSEDEPTPAAKRRRRSGETEGDLRKHMPTVDQDSDQPAARGRFAILQPAKAELAAAITFQWEAFGPPDPCNPFEPMWQQPYTEDHAGFGENFDGDMPPPAWPSPNL
jgi:hypothetical protein